MSASTISESTDLYAGIPANTIVTFKKKVNGVTSVYDLSTATAITARLIGPDGPISSTANLLNTANGADWANGVVAIDFDATETTTWLSSIGPGNYFYFEITLGGVLEAHETGPIYEIKQAQSVPAPDTASGNKGYCTIADVESFLGIELSVEQITQCNTLIKRMETFVDTETGRAWLTGPQTNESHYPQSQNLFVKYVPVSSIETITGRCGLGEAEETLTVDVDFEIMDLKSGHIRLVNPNSYDRIQVSYTPVDSVPGDLIQACVEIVASWLQPTMQPGSFGIDSYSLPDLTVRFARSHVQQVAPPLAMRTLEFYRYPVHA